MILRLYGTSACHLCEEATTLLRSLACEMELHWTEIDIADEDQLMQLYGIKIPVLKREDSDTVLCWPFSKADILHWLSH